MSEHQEAIARIGGNGIENVSKSGTVVSVELVDADSGSVGLEVFRGSLDTIPAEAPVARILISPREKNPEVIGFVKES